MIKQSVPVGSCPGAPSRLFVLGMQLSLVPASSQSDCNLSLSSHVAQVQDHAEVQDQVPWATSNIISNLNF